MVSYTRAGETAATLPRVLFVCPRGAGRSQLAAALWSAAGGEARATATRPVERVYPQVVAALDELGIGHAGERPRKFTAADLDWADLVVHVGCEEALAGARVERVEWSLPEVEWDRPADVRRQRDVIAARIEALRKA